MMWLTLIILFSMYLFIIIYILKNTTISCEYYLQYVLLTSKKIGESSQILNDTWQIYTQWPWLPCSLYGNNNCNYTKFRVSAHSGGNKIVFPAGRKWRKFSFCNFFPRCSLFKIHQFWNFVIFYETVESSFKT